MHTYTTTAEMVRRRLMTSPATVAELRTELGRSDTRIRESLRAMITDGDVVIMGKVRGTTAGYIFKLVRVESEPTPRIRHAVPTTRRVRRVRISNAEVQVIRQGESDRYGNHGDFTSKWAAVCLTHNAMAEFNLVLEAYHAGSYPTFCADCVAAGVKPSTKGYKKLGI